MARVRQTNQQKKGSQLPGKGSQAAYYGSGGSKGASGKSGRKAARRAKRGY